MIRRCGEMDIVYDKENDMIVCPYCNEVPYLQHGGVLFCPDCKKYFSSVTYQELDRDKKFIYEK